MSALEKLIPSITTHRAYSIRTRIKTMGGKGKRKAFSDVLPQHIVRYYTISGKRGEAKKISLPRELVVWE